MTRRHENGLELEDGLERGDLLPRIVTPPPGPKARQLCERLAELEAPGINTLYRNRPGIVWEEALGCNVLDVDGNRYLDLTSGFGVAAVGHRHPKVVAAIQAQSGRLIHGLGDVAGHPLRIELADRLRSAAPIDQAQVYYAVSGADAIEIALKTALLASQRPGILAFDPSYHGLTLGALAATSRSHFRRPFAPYLHPHLARLPFACDLAAIDELLRRDRQIGCALVEPVVGREGVLVPGAGWLTGLADICRDNDVLLIVDEIFTGFGRCGALFACQRENVLPDLLCCGKALAGGLPIGAVLGSKKLFSCWSTDGEARHTATFVAHPLACAAALATLGVLDEDALPERARLLATRVAPRLEGWSRQFCTLAACRGVGLLWGLDLTSAQQAAALVEGARMRGVLLLAGGPEGRVVQLAPPLTITEQQLDRALDLLEEVLFRLDPR